jgi:hypothetical protein
MMNKANKKVVRQILKEELLVFKLNQDILKEHQTLIKERKDFWSVVLEEYLKAEHGEDFDSSLIEEGLWTDIKYYINKLGPLEIGGKIFSKRGERAKAALEKVQAAIEAATKKGFGDFKKNIEAEYKEFPNNPEPVDFRAALYELGGVYDSAEAAVKSGNFPGGAGAANHLVHALREYVKWLLDYKLGDAGKATTEAKEISEAAPPVGGVANVDTPSAGRSPRRLGGTTAGGGGAPAEGPTGTSYTKAGRQGAEVDSATIKGLKSNLFPALLAAGGLLSLVAGLLVGAGWFQELLLGPKEWKEKIKVVTDVLSPDQATGSSQQLGRMLFGDASHYAPNTSAADFMKDALAANPAGGSAMDTLAQLSPNPGTYGNTMQQMFDAGIKKFGSGATMEQVWPASTIGAEASIQLTLPGKVIGQMTKIIVKKMVRSGGSAVIATGMTAAAPWLASLGIALVSAGAAVKLLRMKGLHSSRAKMLKDLYKELVDFPEKTKTDTIIGPTPPEPPIPPEPPEPPTPICADDEEWDEEQKKCVPKTIPVQECQEVIAKLVGNFKTGDLVRYVEEQGTGNITGMEPKGPDGQGFGGESLITKIIAMPGEEDNPSVEEQMKTDTWKEEKVIFVKVQGMVPLEAGQRRAPNNIFRAAAIRDCKLNFEVPTEEDYRAAWQGNAKGAQRMGLPRPEDIAGDLGGGEVVDVFYDVFRKQAKRLKVPANINIREAWVILHRLAKEVGNPQSFQQRAKGATKTTSADLQEASATKYIPLGRLWVMWKKKLGIDPSTPEGLQIMKKLTRAAMKGGKGANKGAGALIADPQYKDRQLTVPRLNKLNRFGPKKKPDAPMVDTVKDMEGDRPGSMRENKTLKRWKTIARIK